MHISIVTGASRGMGEGIALELAKRGHRILGISRGRSEPLAAYTDTEQWGADLADAIPLAGHLSTWLRGISPVEVESITLINNAAITLTPGPAYEANAVETTRALRVGLESVALLTAAFLSTTREWTAAKAVLNISSGNGRRALAGTAVYSALKAGMDHYTRVLALDEAALGARGAKVCSLAPGVIDTDMQTQIRSADPAKFAAHGMFVSYKNEGHLLSPEAAAKRVLAYLNRPDFGANPVADVRDAA
jgi:benzil reductase ((S)-benzoin forming)